MKWCVIDEKDQSTLHSFRSKDEALAYARNCAGNGEGEVLVHNTPCRPDELSAVSLPQEHVNQPEDSAY